MTRFMGRGLWYLFLATMACCALYDTGVNRWFGAICTLYLVVLGVAAMMKGAVMTFKLSRVHRSIRSQGFTADRLLPGGHAGVSGAQFQAERCVCVCARLVNQPFGASAARILGMHADFNRAKSGRRRQKLAESAVDEIRAWARWGLPRVRRQLAAYLWLVILAACYYPPGTGRLLLAADCSPPLLPDYDWPRTGRCLVLTARYLPPATCRLLLAWLPTAGRLLLAASGISTPLLAVLAWPRIWPNLVRLRPIPSDL